MLKYPTRTLPAVALFALSLALTACAMKPDPKYPPGEYFAEPYKSAAGSIRKGHTYFLKRIFRDKNLQADHIGKGNHSLLLYSLSCKNYKAVEFLLEQGADPNLVNPDSVAIGGETVPYPIQPVAYAANDEDPAGLNALLEAGGDPNSKFVNTPAILRAEEANRMKNIKILLDHGANIEGRDGTGRTPLLKAGYLTDWDMVRFFIDQGANWKAYDAMGVTLAVIIQEEIAKDIGTDQYRKDLRKLKSFLERQGVEFPVERVEVSEAAEKKMMMGLSPSARVDPDTGERLEPPKRKKSGNRPSFFIDEQ